MRDILPDRKITGSFKLTPAQAYEEANNGNRSRVHWDMVSIQRREYGGGEVCFDCKLIHRNRFCDSAAFALNRHTHFTLRSPRPDPANLAASWKCRRFR